jgi:DNA processing protein
MDVIEGFWAGAQDHGGTMDWVKLEQLVGGRAAVARAGRAELVAAGADPDRVLAWLRTPPRLTMGQALVWTDSRYPEALRRTLQPPPVLLVDGAVEALGPPGVAVVGTRACTAYGRVVARRLGAELARSGKVVVSGLARGIDGEAHLGAISAGRTVAVLGHGLAHTAPSSHRRLRQRIVEAGGAMVSVWPDELAPREWTFPKRNAWIAGLADAVVVVEAGSRSGALITAKCALAIGRDVFAVPGPVDSPASAGCLALLDDGAAIVTRVEDAVARLTGRTVAGTGSWLDLLGEGCTVDDLSRRTGRPVTAIVRELAQLEVEGRVARVSGQRFILLPLPEDAQLRLV